MIPVQDNNTRWILEQERRELLKNNSAFDAKFGSFSFIFLAGIESLALICYLLIISLLLYCRKTRTKTNAIVIFWALANLLVVFEKLTRKFYDNHEFSRESNELGQIVGGLGRNYGTSLCIVWVYRKYFQRPKPKYDWFLFFLMAAPAVLCLAVLVHYFSVNRFVYETYAPLSDIGNLTAYFFIGFIVVLCKIFDTPCRNTSLYPFLISLVNLVTNIPICFMTIFLRFVLDEGWVYRFHMYFIDFIVNVINCSNAFIVLLIVILYNEDIRNVMAAKKKNDAAERVPFRSEL